MGDWDFYCALCAAPFYIPDLNETSDEINNRNFPENLLSWLSTLQVVGTNPHAHGLSSCYISGEGTASYYGEAQCKSSQDPNCPGVDQGSEKFCVSTYFNYAEMQEGVIPVHAKCLQIFRRVLAREKGISMSELDTVNIDPDTLLGTFREKRNTQFLKCLDVDYYELDKWKNEQYFIYHQPSQFILDPLFVPAMTDYVENMPLLSVVSVTAPTSSTLSHNFSDPFSALPPEILTEILLTLPLSSLSPFMTASPATRRLQLTQSFWQNRIKIHMPWSWEIISHAAQTKKPYDWVTIHSDLQRFSLSDWRIDEKPHLPLPLPVGFANRRRIYHVCEELVRVYVRLETEAQTATTSGLEDDKHNDTAQMLQTAKCIHFPAVSMPLSPELNAVTKFMLPRWSDIGLEKKTMEITWNREGVLAGIGITVRGIRSGVGFGFAVGGEGEGQGTGREKEGDEGEAGRLMKTDTMLLQERDWIDGFEFYMSTSEPKVVGVKIRTLRSPHVTFGLTTAGTGGGGGGAGGVRLMAVEDGSVFVGLKAVVGKDFGITRLGVLECPCPEGIDVDVGLPVLPKLDAETRRLIWKNNLPPTDIRAMPFLTGYNNYGNEATESGQMMEALIFGDSHGGGTSGFRLGALTGFAVSADFLSFFVYYDDDAEPSTAGIGFTSNTSQTLKRFDIDGPGGEKIVQVSLAYGSRPVGLKVLTNRGRQGIFGMHRPESLSGVQSFPPMTTAEYEVAGLYGSFEILRGYNRFTSFGALCHTLSPHEPPPPPIPAAPGAWDPSPPPSHWHEKGPVYGSDEHFALTYLDLTKPVSRIHGLLAAPDRIDITELGGFVVVYADGSSCAIGTPATHLWASIRDAQEAEKEGTIPRHQEMSRGFGKSDEGVVVHVTTEEAVVQNRTGGMGACWDLGPCGGLINAITVWSGPKYLNGVQFHLADGRSSVKWGKCGQAPSVVISTGDATPSAVAVVAGLSDVPVSVGAVGVKFYLDSQRDHYNAADARPIGLQILVADI
ncbi:hypothetical protein GYMLUDRAFT_242466 [Collybiopsis luxurians FD-317 M1]|uniref:F-box domain-containing protein n=1 Tax=Collybiopsis luxurians FD-317 M1 TaxID=944289 RepID=A0A0D0BFY5_9AGAR|nr:hypothetical protein GYMLUDRAFT_242466 [Collybiopsis luxurians FD-317 M1]